MQYIVHCVQIAIVMCSTGFDVTHILFQRKGLDRLNITECFLQQLLLTCHSIYIQETEWNEQKCHAIPLQQLKRSYSFVMVI